MLCDNVIVIYSHNALIYTLNIIYRHCKVAPGKPGAASFPGFRLHEYKVSPVCMFMIRGKYGAESGRSRLTAPFANVVSGAQWQEALCAYALHRNIEPSGFIRGFNAKRRHVPMHCIGI